MNANQKVRQLLKKVYADETVNAMEVWKGYSAYTNCNGWHYKAFGRNEVRFLGSSVSEVESYINELFLIKEG